MPQVNTPPDNPYQSPETTGPTPGHFSFVYLFACLVWCGLTIKWAIIRPITLSFFEEFGVELPLLADWLLNPAMYLFFVIVTISLLLAGLIIRTEQGRRRLGRRSLILALFVVILLTIGIGLPIFDLLKALS